MERACWRPGGFTSAAGSTPSEHCSSGRGRRAVPAAARHRGRAAPDGRPRARRAGPGAPRDASQDTSSHSAPPSPPPSASPAVARRWSAGPDGRECGGSGWRSLGGRSGRSGARSSWASRTSRCGPRSPDRRRRASQSSTTGDDEDADDGSHRGDFGPMRSSCATSPGPTEPRCARRAAVWIPRGYCKGHGGSASDDTDSHPPLRPLAGAACIRSASTSRAPSASSRAPEPSLSAIQIEGEASAPICPKRTRPPSGEKPNVRMEPGRGTLASVVSAPPATSTTRSSTLVGSETTNAIRSPVGDHVGPSWTSPLANSRRCVPSAATMTSSPETGELVGERRVSPVRRVDHRLPSQGVRLGARVVRRHRMRGAAVDRQLQHGLLILGWVPDREQDRLRSVGRPHGVVVTATRLRPVEDREEHAVDTIDADRLAECEPGGHTGPVRRPRDAPAVARDGRDDVTIGIGDRVRVFAGVCPSPIHTRGVARRVTPAGHYPRRDRTQPPNGRRRS